MCAKALPLSARIVGVDLDPIRAVRGATTLVDDITTQRCRERLRKVSEGSLFDVVLHDGAPNVGGAFATESYTQSALVLDACKLACEFLRPDGTFVTKIFRSKDYTALLYAFRQLFARVDATKPAASRGTSAEIFVVCSGFKAPAKVDPRLLDHRTLFQVRTASSRAAAVTQAMLQCSALPCLLFRAGRLASYAENSMRNCGPTSVVALLG